MTDDSHTLLVWSWTALVWVEQAQDGGDHRGFLTGRRHAENVVAGTTLGNANDLAAGSLNGLQATSIEHRQRVLLQAEAEPAVACYTLIHAGLPPWPWPPFRRNAARWQQDRCGASYDGLLELKPCTK